MKEEKKSIFLASTLKPINDTRMYEKFALSLAKSYKVIVFGFEAPLPSHTDITFISLLIGKRIFWYKQFWQSLKKHQPTIIIVHHPELLPVALYYKLKVPKTIVFYDMQENYFRNFHYQTIYPFGLKTMLGIAFRVLEYFSFPFLQKIFCAEQCYLSEIPFLKQKAIVLENKFQENTPLKETYLHPITKKNSLPSLKYVEQKNRPLKALLCGTISKVFGTEKALEFIHRLNEKEIIVELKIIGKGVEKELIEKIKKEANQHIYLRYEGLDALVPHAQIMAEMKQADVILLPYISNKSTENCIPTKLYECMALGIPMFIQENKLWEKITATHQAAIMLDFETATTQIVSDFFQKNFYPNGIVKAAFWENEERKLLKVIDELW